MGKKQQGTPARRSVRDKLLALLADMRREIEARDAAVKSLEFHRGDYLKGDLWAITWALTSCAAYGVPPPAWVQQATMELVEDYLELKRHRGRTGNSEAQRKQQLIHLTRWGTVKDLRLNHRDRVRTWDDAYREASRKLRGHPAQGGEEAMRASYKRIARLEWPTDDEMINSIGQRECRSKKRRAPSAAGTAGRLDTPAPMRGRGLGNHASSAPPPGSDASATPSPGRRGHERNHPLPV